MSTAQNALIFTTLLACAAAQADTVAGVYVGGHYWWMDSDAYAEAANGLGGTTRADFDFGSEGQGSLWLAVEHPIPALPNLMVRYNQLGGKDVTTLAGDIEIDGKLYQAGSELVLDARLDHLDFVLYYELLDNDLVELDLGLNIKWGDFELRGSGIIEGADSEGNSESISANYSIGYSGVLPLLYAAGKVAIPTTGISLFGEVSGLAYQDHKLYDAQIGIGYDIIDNPLLVLTGQLGYRVFKAKSDDLDDIAAELNFDGAFMGLVAHF